MEETNWSRDHTSAEDLTEREQDHHISGNDHLRGDSLEEKDVAKGDQRAKDGHNDLELQHSAGQGQTHYTHKTFRNKLKLVNSKGFKDVTLKSMFGQVIRPILYVRFPVVVFCGISVGCYQMWLSFLNGTESVIMTGSYGFSTSMLGVPFVSPIIFALFG